MTHTPTRLEQLVLHFTKLNHEHRRLAATVRDPNGYLSLKGVARAKANLRHSNITLAGLKADIIAELET